MRLFQLSRIDRLSVRLREPSWVFCPGCGNKYLPGEKRKETRYCPVCEGSADNAHVASDAVIEFLTYARDNWQQDPQVFEDMEFLAENLAPTYAQFEVRRTLRALRKLAGGEE